MQDLVASGQLKLSKIPSERNPADVLTKYLQASTLHKLLPKLGVITRAVDSKDLLSVISFDGQGSSQPATSFFIGMLAETMFPHSLLLRELTAEGACQDAAYHRRVKKSTSLPREALHGAAFVGSLFAVQLCFVCRSSSRSLTSSFMVLCFRESWVPSSFVTASALS